MAEEFAAGLVKNIKQLAANLASIPDDLASQLLADTYLETPRPPWNTGELRDSGAVYVGSRLVATTVGMFGEAGINPKGDYALTGKTGLATGGVRYPLMRMSQRKLLKANRNYAAVSTVRDQITVFYQAPHAALMHDWPGAFSDPDSGAGYVSLKLVRFSKPFEMVIRQHWQGTYIEIPDKSSPVGSSFELFTRKFK